MAPKFIEELVPAGSVPDFLFERQVRRKIRYWLFRLRSESEGLAKRDGIPKGLSAYYKKQEWFDGWDKFGESWDLDEQDYLKTVPRWESIHEEWERVLDEEHRTNRIQARRRRRLKDSDGSEGDV